MAQASVPTKGVLNLEVDELHSYGTVRKPVLSLVLTTQEGYRAGTYLAGHLTVRGAAIAVNIEGPRRSIEMLSSEPVPARFAGALPIKQGSYALTITTAGGSDTYRLTVTDRKVDLVPVGTPTVSTPAEERFWRLPVASTALFCDDRSRLDLTIECAALVSELGDRVPGLQRLRPDWAHGRPPSYGWGDRAVLTDTTRWAIYRYASAKAIVAATKWYQARGARLARAGKAIPDVMLRTWENDLWICSQGYCRRHPDWSAGRAAN
jgi:hypothetical protein